MGIFFTGKLEMGICLVQTSVVLSTYKRLNPNAGCLGQSLGGGGALAPQWAFTRHFTVFANCLQHLEVPWRPINISFLP